MANLLVKKSNIKQKNKLIFNKYKQFNLTFLLAAFLPVLGVGLFNFIIDPYDIFNSPNLEKLNDVKVADDNNDRLFKAVDIIRIKPTTIILGSSRSKQGINPDNPLFKNKQPAYNLAINGPNVYEVKRYLQHAITNQKDLNLVVLGIDFFMFNKFLENQPSFLENRLEKKYIIPQDAINALFSLDTLDKSWQTVNESIKKDDDPNYGINGFMPHRKANDGNTKWRFNSAIKQYFDFHNQYELSEQYVNDFREIVSICQENNIELMVFISPSHATQWEAIRVTGKWDTFEQWKRELVKFVPVWDFSGYDKITTEPIEDQMSNYTDNSHYTPSVGNLVLNRIFNRNAESIPNDFGILITPENIEQHLANIRQQREIYVQNNSDQVQLVEDIHKKFLKDNQSL